MITTKYHAKHTLVRQILDMPNWIRWLEFEIEHIKSQCEEFSMTVADFKPDALEWAYYHDACLKPGSHEIVELLSRMAEAIPVKYHRYLHRGLTSSNVIDSCNHRKWNALSAMYGAQYARFHSIFHLILNRQTSVRGYTHGKLATVTTLEHRAMSALERPRAFQLPEKVTGGPVGVNDLMIYHRQAMPRTAYFALWHQLLVGSAGLAQMATDYRFYLSDFKVGVSASHQGTTSSAMPGKNNPSQFERICSLDLLIRGMVCTLYQTPPQWLDRDLVHSAMERETIDRLWEYAFYQLEQMTTLVLDVKVESEEEIPQQEETSDRFQTLIDAGHDWHTARRLSTSLQ